MKPYLERIWKTRKTYIVAAILLLGTTVLTRLMHPSIISPASLGIGAGTILTLIVFLGPVVYIDVKGIKVANPKPVFFEPKPWKMGILFLLIDVLWTATLSAILIIPNMDQDFEKTLDADGFMAGFTMIPLIFGYILLPVLVYSVFIKTRYKRIVEYGSYAWNRRNKKP